MRILVVGAGIAGLSAARMLAAEGHEVVVAEQAPAIRAEGAGLLLHRRAVAALHVAGFEVAAIGSPLESMAITTPGGGARGAVRDRISFARPELLEVLLRGADEVADVRLGQRVSYSAWPPARGARSTSASRSTTVDCTVGDRQECFDFVVGADGISSATRAVVHPSVEVLRTGQMCWRGIVTMASGSHGTEMWDGAVRVEIVPLSQGRTYAYVVTAERSQGDRGLHRLVGSGVLPAREQEVASRLLALPASSRSRLEVRELRRPTWGRGRIALIGDAAHAITPNLGLGAALAIEDVIALRRALTDSGDTVDRYRRRRRLPVSATQLASRRLGHLAHGEAALPRALRSLVGLRRP